MEFQQGKMEDNNIVEDEVKGINTENYPESHMQQLGDIPQMTFQKDGPNNTNLSGTLHCKN